MCSNSKTPNAHTVFREIQGALPGVFNTVQYSAVQYSTVQYSSVSYSIIQEIKEQSAVQYR